MLFKGYGIVIHVCEQCGRVLSFFLRVYFRYGLRKVWRHVEGLNPQDTSTKLATHQLYLFAVRLISMCVRAPLCLPTHLHLNLSLNVLQIVGG